MPIVLTQNEATQSGHVYADIFGVEYEYPNTYRNIVGEGEPFVYYRGRQRAAGGRQPQVYLGAGVIGEISPSRTQPGRWVCALEDVELFTPPVPFKIDGVYLESLGRVKPEHAGRYFQRACAELTMKRFAAS